MSKRYSFPRMDIVTEKRPVLNDSSHRTYYTAYLVLDGQKSTWDAALSEELAVMKLVKLLLKQGYIQRKEIG